MTSDNSNGEIMLRNYAITYPQLMLQAVEAGYATQDLQILSKAYELAEEAFDGIYRGQRVPVICHLVRTAGIVMSEKLPVEYIAGAMLHAFYLHGKFPFGSVGGEGAKQRQYVASRIGGDIEKIIYDYHRTKVYSEKDLTRIFESLPTLTKHEKSILIMRIANELEDYLDAAILFRGTFPYKKMITSQGEWILKIADALGLQTIKQELQEMYKRHLNHRLPCEIFGKHAYWYDYREKTYSWRHFIPYKAKRFFEGIRKNGK